MASHQLAIAKASFSAGLLRPDPKSVSRDEIAHFHTLLNLVTTECSPANIQNCKRWILCHISQSAARFAALGKYLSTLSTSFTGPAKPSASTTLRREPSGKRKCLHLLYLINDLLHHAKRHTNDASVASKAQPFLVGLLSSAASFKSSPKHHRKIEALLDIWEDRHYYSTDCIDKLREAVKIAPEAARSTETSEYSGRNNQADVGVRPAKNTPFIIPAMHGDPGTPWYDLPAGNLMPHIIPNSTRPINPTLVKPLQFVAGPADEALANAVKDLLHDVNTIFGVTQTREYYADNLRDIDELGQPIIRDEMTAEVLSGEGYYGWSKAFCEKMKRRRKGLDYPRIENDAENRRRGRTRGRSRSSSRSSHHVKKRRYSESDEDRSRSHSRSWPTLFRRAYSSSRSPSRERGRGLRQDRDSGTSPGSMSGSVSPNRRSHNPHKWSYSPHPQSPQHSPDGNPTENSRNHIPGPFGASFPNEPELQNIPPPQALIPLVGDHFGPGVSPIPPAPPPQYLDQWPPPPPPMMPYGQQTQQGGPWPPPPPPPPQFVQGNQHWQPAALGQPPGGPGGWTLPPQHLGNSRGTYEGRGRGFHSAPQQQHQSEASGYNGYTGSRGNPRGRGWP